MIQWTGQEEKIMTIFSIVCYVLFGYLAVAGVLLFTKGFHKDVGVEKR